MKFNDDMKTSWKHRGKSFSVSLNNIQSSKYYESTGVIGYLIGKELHNPKKLVVYSLEGILLCDVSPPSGFQFEYLTSHPKADVAIVCGVIDMETSKESWSDFYFGLDIRKGVLTRIGIAR